MPRIEAAHGSDLYWIGPNVFANSPLEPKSEPGTARIFYTALW
jgi:hypothetical protein